MAAGPAIASPCTGICTVEENGLCAGCARTLDEIAGWSAMTPGERRAIMAALPARRSRAPTDA